MAHIQHLVEDRNITLGTIKKIINAAANGSIRDATEKLDGVNIMFTCNSKYEVRFARSDSDIKANGMIAAMLEAKYTGRGLVQETFSKGATAIRTAVRALTVSELKRVFDDGKLWYSAEIIYTKNPNVVRYAQDGVVLHERPVLRKTTDGAVHVEQNAPFATLERLVPEMNELVLAIGWRCHGPQRFVIASEGMDEHAKTVYDALDHLGDEYQTLQACLNYHAELQLLVLGVRPNVLPGAAKRLAEDPTAPSLTTLKKLLSESTINQIRKSDEWIASRLAPLDFAIQRFSAEFLSRSTSNLVVDNEIETARINDELRRCIGRIHTSRNSTAIAMMETQLLRFGNEVKVTTPVEGIVFPWNGKLYKLTGSFAPANAIMGLVKYGRGKAVPPLERM